MTAAVITGRTLVLNKSWMPVNIISVTDAVEKVCAGRAVFLDVETFQTYDFESWVVNWDDAIRAARIEAEKVIHSTSVGLFKPEVIVCTEYKGIGYKTGKRRPKFSRTNLYRRDRNQCQYCGKKGKTEDMTMDHVVPKEKGGEATWQNIVLACIPCNQRKKNRTPEQAKMKLLREPRQPKVGKLKLNPMERLQRKIGKNAPKTWEQFLGKMYWNIELQD